MKHKKNIVIIIIVVAMLLTSCNGSQEVDELGIVIATAIDIEDGEFILTHEVIVPETNVSSNTDKKDSGVIYVQSKGNSMIEAIRNASLIFDRKLFLAHNRLFILGEEFAKVGIIDFINFYVYDNEPRESANMIVAKDSKAYEVMGINGGLSKTPGRYLSGLIENYNINLKTRNLTLIEFLRYYLRDNNPVTAVVEKIEELEIDKEAEQSTKKALDVSGGAVFHMDKLKGYYNAHEMMGFNFIVDDFENGIIVFETPDELLVKSELIGDSGKYTVAEVKNSKTKKRVELVDGELRIIIDVNIKAALVEDTKGLNVSHKDILNAVEESCSNQVKDYINMTMDKAQKEFKVDTFSINSLVHIKYPDLWKDISDDWDSIFPNLNYTVNVHTNFIRTGLLNIPVNIKKGLK